MSDYLFLQFESPHDGRRDEKTWRLKCPHCGVNIGNHFAGLVSYDTYEQDSRPGHIQACGRSGIQVYCELIAAKIHGEQKDKKPMPCPTLFDLLSEQK